jgi:hypothetical protein
MAGLLGRVISPSQGLCLYKTAQHRKTRTNIHAVSGIQTRDRSVQAANTHVLDSATTEIDVEILLETLFHI